MNHPLVSSFAAVAAVLAFGSVARAQTPTLSIKLPAAAAPVSDLSDPRLFRVTAPPTPEAARPAGTVKTAIDHAFGSKDGVTGSLGYLCGLQPGPNETSGFASSYYEVGTFLGAQLHLAF